MSTPAKQLQPESPLQREPRIVRPTRQVAALLGFLLKAEADAIFHQQPFETVDGADPLELWRRFDVSRSQLPPVRPAQVEALPATLRDSVEKIKDRQTFKRHYEAVADYSFMAVPIDCLLAPQWYADLDYIDEIVATSNREMDLEQQLHFAMSEGKITEPIVTGNQVWFTSPRRDLFAEQIPAVRKVGEGEFEIVVRAASRPNYIQVAAVDNRLLLVNGVHKVCALTRMGYKNCVCAFRQVHNVSEIGLNLQTSLFRDAILKSERPALVTDFLNPLAGVPLKMRSQYQVLQVAVNVGTISVPALPNSTPI